MGTRLKTQIPFGNDKQRNWECRNPRLGTETLCIRILPVLIGGVGKNVSGAGNYGSVLICGRTVLALRLLLIGVR
jgi:hypothetical protein